MSKDITAILANWPKDEAMVTARLIKGEDSVEMIQVRLDCGLLQMYLDGRPDGTRPHGHETYFEYLQRHCQSKYGGEAEQFLHRNEQVWELLDRELSQFYHRRLALLALAKQFQQAGRRGRARRFYSKAVRDANHTLQAMNFIKQYCDDADHVESHERFKPFVLWHRTLALAQMQMLAKDFDEAIEQVKLGMDGIAKVYESHGLKKWLRYDPSLAELRTLEREIRRKYGVKATLKEQLQQAIGSENFELAARIRDTLRAKGKFDPHLGRAIPR